LDKWIEKQSQYEQKIESLRLYIERIRDDAEDKYRGRTLTTENKLVLQEYTPSDRHAIVTMFGSSSYVHAYWMGALAMIQSLRESQTRVPHIIVMVRSDELVPQIGIDAFREIGAELVYIENLKLDELNVKIPGTWEGAFDKLNVWTLTDYEKILFLDADTLIVQNIDHLFNYDELTAPYTPTNCQCHADFAKNPVYFTISSGFFILKPSMERFQQVVQLASGPSPDPDDLAQFEGTWHWGDQEMLRVVFTQLSDQWNALNWEYDLPVGMCSCAERRTKPIYSYHFVCTYPVPKPWSDGRDTLYKPTIRLSTRDLSSVVSIICKGNKFAPCNRFVGSSAV